MSQIKRLLPIMLSGMFLSAVYADAQRTNFSVENQFPAWGQFEVGAYYEGVETDQDEAPMNADSGKTAVYMRYGIFDNLTVEAEIPYLNLDFPGLVSESGFGDIEIGFQLLTYEDIFGYPYFIPYASFTLPTGDEDNGLGADGTTITAGLAYGSTINDWIHWVFDFSYIVNPDFDDQIQISNSYVWELDESFALVTEIMYREAVLEGVDSLVLVAAGFTYDWTESLQIDLSIGGGLTGDTEAYGKANVSYTF